MCDFFPPGIMSGHGLLSSVFSCSQGSKSAFKRRLRQTRSLDSAMMMRPRGSEGDEPTRKGDFSWKCVHGSSVGLQPVPLQSLSELERVRLQEVAFCRLLDDHDLGCQISLPKDGQKRKKSLRRKLDSLSRERSKDKDHLPQAFGVPLAAVIANDRAYKQRLDAGPQGAQESRRDRLSSSNSSLSSTCETPTEPPATPCRPDAAQRTHRRGGVSVDCITDLDDSQSRILEALQLALPTEAPGNRKKHRDRKLSLNPMYQQVPRVVDWCCQHLEKHGLQTEGIFRKGSNNSRVKQLREEFDQGLEVPLDEEQNVHEVAALLKEFLRDLPHPLLTRELYTAFINSMFLDNSHQVLQLLIFLLPPCNSDTLQHILHFLSNVASHADDRLAGDGAEITGNKMTARNLATIFGPNLLHMQKNSDKEFEVQSLALANDRMAIIAVVLSMITNYRTLFMVPCDLQNEVLTSILETDCDVVEPLLRRKDSQYSSSGLLRPALDEDSDPGERRWSCGSHRDEDSSGEVSPYDNNSPVLSDHPARRGAAGDTGEGSHGDVFQCGSGSPSEGLHRHPGSGPWAAVRRTQSAADVAGHRPHPPLTGRSSSDRLGRRPAMTPSYHRLHGQSGASSSEDLAARTDANAGRRRTHSVKALWLSGSLRHSPVSNSAPSLSTSDRGWGAAGPHSVGSSPKPPLTPGAGVGPGAGPAAPECRAKCWSIKQLFCAGSTDDLPESLV